MVTLYKIQCVPVNVGVIARGTEGGREPVGLFFAIDMVVHLLLNGISSNGKSKRKCWYTYQVLHIRIW